LIPPDVVPIRRNLGTAKLFGILPFRARCSELHLSMNPACNIELKARLRDVAAARTTALRVATECLGIQQQTDTYFYCPQGRMKLREIVEFEASENHNSPAAKAKRRSAQLIAYDRADLFDAKESYYQLVEITDPRRVRQLKTQMSIRAVVEKRRQIFVCGNVRIHLDEVAGLGAFLEFEAVLGSGIDARMGRKQVASLREEFDIQPDDLLDGSYIDLLLETTSA
jgi:adenylate cyclase, class 2